jgi:hypothetical protein
MGNRAVITFGSKGSNAVGVYIHWNGGRDSVRAFLEVCRARGYRCPTVDKAYAMAGLVGVISEFFGKGGLSVGVDILKNLDCDNYDNGVYQVGKNWEIVGTWGQGAAGLEYTNGQLYGAEKDKFEGIVAQLSESVEV